MRCLLLSFFALIAVAQSQAQGSVTGQYQLRMSEDAARYARLAGKSTVAGRLSLHVTGRFTLEVGDSVKHGNYRVDDDHITLSVEDGRTMGGILRDGRISLEGLDFERPSAARRFPTDASTGRRDPVVALPPAPAPAPVVVPKAAVVVPAPTPAPVAVFVPAPVAPVVAAAPRPVRAWKAADCCGGWTVRQNGEEQKGQRMDLRKDGTFRFSMVGATSEGKWSVTEEGTILLIWTKIDGELVEEGTVRKNLPVSDDGSAFQIDTYRYERATQG